MIEGGDRPLLACYRPRAEEQIQAKWVNSLPFSFVVVVSVVLFKIWEFGACSSALRIGVTPNWYKGRQMAHHLLPMRT